MEGWYARAGGNVPLINVKVRGHVGGEAGRGRRILCGLYVEVVHATFPHAHIPEVEALRAHRVCSEERLRGRQVTAVAPRAGQGRRVHGCQRRRHLHAAKAEEGVGVGGGGGGQGGSGGGRTACCERVSAEREGVCVC
jgi:hypothetical protein